MTKIHIPIAEQLAIRQQERDALLQRITDLLVADEQICTAWLFGSGFRGDGDALSDIDLWTVVEDDALPGLLADRVAYISQVGTPLLALNVRGNAPVGGGYLMVQFLGSVGPFQVDWYWQPRSSAWVPSDAKLLFDRTTLPQAPQQVSCDFSYISQRLAPPPLTPALTVSEELAHHVAFAWCMALIGAKKVARHDPADASTLLFYAEQMLRKVEWLLADSEGDRSSGPEMRTDASLQEVHGAIVQVHQTLTALLPQLATKRVRFAEQTVPTVERFFQLTKEIADANHDSPTHPYPRRGG